MTYAIWKSATVFAGVLAATLSAGTAHADGMPGLKGWAKDAGRSVEKVMSYPAMAERLGNEGTASFRVTVDRAGNLVSFDQTERIGSPMLNGAARRVVNRTKFPALPANYGQDTMTFAVRLQYAIVADLDEATALRREGHVTSEALASNGTPMVASIEILDAQN